MHTSKLPIIVVEGFDVSLHSSIEEVEKWLEPWWVRQNEGSVYDASGNLLKAIVVVDKVPQLFGARLHEKTQILRDTPVVDASDELRSALIGHLMASGIIQDSISLEGASLELLISLIAQSQRTN